MAKKSYVIVGAGAGGISAAIRLRRLDENATITVYEKGAYADLAFSGLPYYIGGIIGPKHALYPVDAAAFSTRYNIEVRLHCEVQSILRNQKRVTVLDLQTGKTHRAKYDKLILATGTEPVLPKALDMREGVYTLKTPDDLTAIMTYIDAKNVRRAAVVGGGVIGLEVAENLSRRGIKTCVVEIREHALPFLDGDMAQFVRMVLEDHSVALVTRAEVLAAEQADGGVRLALSEQRSIIVDIVVVCAGLRPQVTLARKAGLGIGVTGGVIVDERQMTTDKDIFAVGDMVEVESLHGGKTLISCETSARRQGHIAADTICGIGGRYRYMAGLSAVRLFDTTFAGVGLTERQLIERELRYQKVYVTAPSNAPYYPNAQPLMLKLLFDKRNGVIFGAQVVGRKGADKRIDVLATAMRGGLTADKLADLELSNAPALGSAEDVVGLAGYAATNVMHGLTDIVHWHDLKNIPDAVLLDVRTQAERDAGTIAWSQHIPLAELRSRLAELPRDKEIIVFCQDGRRSHEAERILHQHGFKAKNLSGGYSLYELFKGKG